MGSKIQDHLKNDIHGKTYLPGMCLLTSYTQFVKSIGRLWLVTGSCVLLTVFACQAKRGKDAKDMEDSKIIQEFHDLDPSDPEAVERLAERIKAESREAPEAMVRFWMSGEESDSEKAVTVMLELDELVLNPLLEVFEESQSQQRVQIMSWAVDLQVALREEIIAKLDHLLDDRTYVLIPELGEPDEESPVPRRVCDEAYLLMRRLLKFNEDEVNYELNASEFLELPEEEKDLEIQKARNSKTWTNWLGEAE